MKHLCIAIFQSFGRVADITPGSPLLFVRVPEVIFLTSQGCSIDVTTGTRLIPSLTCSIANSEGLCWVVLPFYLRSLAVFFPYQGFIFTPILFVSWKQVEKNNSPLFLHVPSFKQGLEWQSCTSQGGMSQSSYPNFVLLTQTEYCPLFKVKNGEN